MAYEKDLGRWPEPLPDVLSCWSLGLRSFRDEDSYTRRSLNNIFPDGSVNGRDFSMLPEHNATAAGLPLTIL